MKNETQSEGQLASQVSSGLKPEEPPITTSNPKSSYFTLLQLCK